MIEFLFFFPLSSIHFFVYMQHFGEISEVETMPRPASQNIDPAKARCRHLKLFTVAEKS